MTTDHLKRGANNDSNVGLINVEKSGTCQKTVDRDDPKTISQKEKKRQKAPKWL